MASASDGRVEHHVIELAHGPEAAATVERAIGRLMRFRVFPTRIMSATVCAPDGRVAPGTTIVQRFPVGPLALEFGSRVEAVWDESDEQGRSAGFTHATLSGHPARGVETLRVDLDGRNATATFTIESRSRPGTVLTALAGPVTRWLQGYAVRAALASFREAALHMPAAPDATGPPHARS